MTKSIIGSIVIFIAIFVSDFFIHGFLLESAYLSTAHIWRTPQEMETMMFSMLVGQIIFAIAFYLFFLKYAKDGESKIKQGIIYGTYLGVFFAASNLIWYSVLPLPFTLAAQWIVYSIVQSMFLGGVVGFICEKQKA